MMAYLKNLEESVHTVLLALENLAGYLPQLLLCCVAGCRQTPRMSTFNFSAISFGF